MKDTAEKRVGYKKTQIGWIPQEWHESKLGDIGKLFKGKGISKAEIRKSGIPCIRYGELYTRYNIYFRDALSFCDSNSASQSQKIQYGDILFAGSGETADEIGKAVAYIGHQTAYAGGDIIIFRPKQQNSLFLSFMLNHGSIKRQMSVQGQGHSVVHIYPKGIAKLQIPLPPLPEQRKIARILATWDRAIELTEKLIAAKEQRKKGLMQQLLTGKRRFREFEGEKWKQSKLGDFGDLFKGKGISKAEISENGLPCIRYGELYTRYNFYFQHTISFCDSKSASQSQEIQYGDILFAGSGETADEIGKPVAYIGNQTAYAGGDIIIFRPQKQNSLFLAFMLNHGNAKRQMSVQGQGHSVVHIYPGGIAKLQIPLPPLPEQQRIAAVLQAADREIALLRQKLAALRQQKKGLMQQLLTGKVRVYPVE